MLIRSVGMDAVLPDIPINMRGLFLRIAEISHDLNSNEEEDDLAAHSEPMEKPTNMGSRNTQSDGITSSMDPNRRFTKKELDTLFDGSGAFFKNEEGSFLKPIQSIFTPPEAKDDTEAAYEFAGFSHSSSSSSSSVSNKAEKNRLAQQAYRKRKAEYMKILEARSSLLSVLDIELKNIQEQLARTGRDLLECRKERDSLLNELNMLKGQRSKGFHPIPKELKMRLKDKHPERSLSDASTGSSGGSSVKSFEYSPYLDQDFWTP